MALPQSLAFDIIPNSAQSRTYKTAVSSRNSTSFNSNQRAEFALPTAEGSYLDLSNVSLKFNITAVGASTKKAFLDFSAYSCISRVVVSCGSQILSDTSSYGVLKTALIQSGCSAESLLTAGLSSIGASGRPDLPLLGAEIIATGAKSFTLPLKLGIFSCKKQLPLDTSSPVVVSVYFASLDDASYCNGDDTHKPSNFLFEECEIHGYVVQLNAEAQMFLDQSLGEMSYNFSFQDVSNVQASHASSTNTNTVLPFRYSSAKCVLQIIRENTSASGGTTQFSTSGRTKNYVSEYWLDIGGQSVPSRHIKLGPDDTGESFCETMVSLYGGAELSHQSSLNTFHCSSATTPAAGQPIVINFAARNCFALDNSALGTPSTYTSGSHQPGTFFSAIDLSSYKNADDSESVMSGLNSIGSQMSWNNKASQSMSAATYDYYCIYDSVISLDPSTRILQANA